MPPTSSLPGLIRLSICPPCRRALQHGQRASFTSAIRLAADEASSPAPARPGPPRPTSDLRNLVHHLLPGAQGAGGGKTTSGLLAGTTSTGGLQLRKEPHHLHLYATKHNTHLTLTRPNREPVISLSSGNLGFKKARRGTFDAAFQLGAYFMRMLQDKGLLRQVDLKDKQYKEASTAIGTNKKRRVEQPIENVEVVLRGFGEGRDAFTKVLLGAEGKVLRQKVVMVSDDTKIKFGGCRGQNPRRLG